MSVEIKQDAIVQREKLAQIQPFDRSAYLSTYGTSLEGVDYTDPDAVGTNPTATLYPDGTIVGSTDNGQYIKYPNGEITIYGMYRANDRPLSVANQITFAFVYPIPLILNAHLKAGVSLGFGRADDLDYGRISVASVGDTSCSITKYGTYGISSGDFLIVSKWK